MTDPARTTHEPKGGFTCLIVEDDPGFAELERRLVGDEGGVPTVCHTLAQAAAATAGRAYDVVLLDNHLPDGQAYDWYDRMSRRNPDAPIIMITGVPDLTEAIRLTRNGLFEYLTKPVEAEQLVTLIRRARQRREHREATDAAHEMLGSSAAMRVVFERLKQAARHTTATVLFTGESGTGKDVAARSLHRLTFGPRAGSAPYVAFNCAAVPPEMFEAELFGAERGAYTGAERRRSGLVEAAQSGTFFLDEIGETPLPLQAKLLRFLEAREFRSLGGTGSQAFTGRFVAATNKDLRAEAAAGRFREDLLYRLEVITVPLPPLRERREDIPMLAERLLGDLARRYERELPLIPPEHLAALRQHDFPGNVRELRNILERSLLRTPEDAAWLMLDSSGMGNQRPSAPPCPFTPGPKDQVERPAVGPDLPPERTDLTPLEAQEYGLIRQTLRETHGGIRRAAAKLGLSPQALLRRLDKWPELRPTRPAGGDPRSEQR